MKKILIPGGLMILAGVGFMAYQHGHLQDQHVSPYSGQESRSIKSLSADDVAQLREGKGWGLAKAAELNGMPGPIHLLDARDELALSDSQVSAITAIYEKMNASARDLGATLIELEQDLELQIRDRSITHETLKRAMDEIADTRKSLRYAHLAAHLETPAILSEEQINKYNSVRGYLNPNVDPCSNVPDGHNAAMWRKHNGCG